MEDRIRIKDITDQEKHEMIDKLVEELPVLRLKVGISQDELASAVGISRQTYSSMETKKRKMSWSLFLSLILIFDYHSATHDLIRSIGVFPERFLNPEGDKQKKDQIGLFSLNSDEIKSHLDEQAIHAIETVIMVEYARCNKLSSEAVIKAFNGRQILLTDEEDVKVRHALDEIRARSAHSDNGS